MFVPMQKMRFPNQFLNHFEPTVENLYHRDWLEE